MQEDHQGNVVDQGRIRTVWKKVYIVSDLLKETPFWYFSILLKIVFLCPDLQYSDSGSSDLEEVETKDGTLVQLPVIPPGKTSFELIFLFYATQNRIGKHIRVVLTLVSSCVIIIGLYIKAYLRPSKL